MEKELILIGDIRYSKEASILYSSGDASKEFLLELQKLMQDFGVVKVDVAIDAYALAKNCKYS